jgi:hypothetical protein
MYPDDSGVQQRQRGERGGYKMALAPNHETANLLHVAIDVAASELREPIDRIEFVGRQILVSAGTKRLALNYYRSNPCDENGIPFAGGGRYHVVKAELLPASQTGPTGLLSWVRKMFPRKV